MQTLKEINSWLVICYGICILVPAVLLFFFSGEVWLFFFLFIIFFNFYCYSITVLKMVCFLLNRKCISSNHIDLICLFVVVPPHRWGAGMKLPENRAGHALVQHGVWGIAQVPLWIFVELSKPILKAGSSVGSFFHVGTSSLPKPDCFHSSSRVGSEIQN